MAEHTRTIGAFLNAAQIENIKEQYGSNLPLYVEEKLLSPALEAFQIVKNEAAKNSPNIARDGYSNFSY